MPDSGLAGDLELRAVTFGYVDGSTPLLTDLSLHLTPGKRIALVGPSGCGKSTVSRLVAGWYQPWSGELLVDGRPRDEWPERLLTSDIALVDQDPFIFAGTFRDNITMADPTVAEADVLRAPPTPACTTTSSPGLAPTRRYSPKAARTCLVASANGWRSPGRWCAIRR